MAACICGATNLLSASAVGRLETNEPTFFIEKVPAGIAPDAYSKACAEAFGIWSKVGDIRFIEVGRREDAIIIVTLREMPKKSFGNYVLGTATYPNGVGELQYLNLNSLRRWVVSASKYVGLMDVRHTLRHESGHLIGLAHPTTATSKDIMNKAVNKNILVPSKSEAALVARLYGSPKR